MLATIMQALDTTIANVSVPHITGNLAVSSSQGTWVITSYAVAEAICVPLTSWLAGRFGTVRVFVFGLIGFTIFSFLCGLATSLEMLVFFRIGQGLCGGHPARHRLSQGPLAGAASRAGGLLPA